MEIFVHQRKDTIINIYKHTESLIDGTFFGKKPKAGDIIMSHVKRETSFCYVYVVEKIISQKDAVISNDCTHNPIGARMKIEIRNVTEDNENFDIENSVKNVLK